MRRIATMSWIVCLAALAGCSDSKEKVAKDAAGVMKEMNDILDGVKDKASADAAAPKIDKLADKMKEIETRLTALKIDKNDDAFHAQMEKDSNGEEKRFIANMMRISMNPELAGSMDRLMSKIK